MVAEGAQAECSKSVQDVPRRNDLRHLRGVLCLRVSSSCDQPSRARINWRFKYHNDRPDTFNDYNICGSRHAADNAHPSTTRPPLLAGVRARFPPPGGWYPFWIRGSRREG